MKKQILRILLLTSLIFCVSSLQSRAAERPVGKSVVMGEKETLFGGTVNLTDAVETAIKEKEVEEEPELYKCGLTENEIRLIALVTMAEAEGESETGKRLVIDTILNRVDSGYFPDSVYEVIYQPNQFSSVWNGRIQRCYVSDDICRLVREEAEKRLNNDCIFFTAGGYSKYGAPMFQVGNHYFSSYE